MLATPFRPTDTVGAFAVRHPLAAVRLAVVLTEDERKRRIAHYIRRAREQRGLTPPQVAEAVGVGRGTVNDWEAARSTPSLVHLGPLCVVLGVAPSLFAELPSIPEDPIAAYFVGDEKPAASVLRKRRVVPVRSVDAELSRRDSEDAAALELEAEAEAARRDTSPQSPDRQPPEAGPPESRRGSPSGAAGRSGRRDP